MFFVFLNNSQKDSFKAFCIYHIINKMKIFSQKSQIFFQKRLTKVH